MFKKNKEVSIYGVIDERTKSIVYQGDAYSGRFMLFALLIDVVIRGLNLDNPLIASNWDLMLIVLIGGLISSKEKNSFNSSLFKWFRHTRSSVNVGCGGISCCNKDIFLI